MIRVVRSLNRAALGSGLIRNGNYALNRPATAIGANRNLFTEAIPSIPELIQSSMLALHTATGIPWWATIGLSTVFVRTALLPLVRSQIIASKKLALAMPEMNYLYKLQLRRLNGVKVTSTYERLRIISVFVKGVNACLKVYDVPKRKLIGYPLMNIGVFMTFVYSVRDLLLKTQDYSLLDGGTLWFVDLASKDATFGLPFAALGLTYLGLELAFRQNSQDNLFSRLKDYGQSGIILFLPFVTQLPAGVFCYWIPSSIFAITQSQILKGPYAQKLFNIPDISPPAHMQAPKMDEKGDDAPAKPQPPVDK